ncbi:Putative transporting ATPase [Photobacterium marinum]|uniref:Putative transporting ATPase n=1 Tax=Photobacterium marinum TaxID=1056511 RepID=L8J851_9GAMM|nr:Putative transporting ATPase [Photobacterium marinum]
MYLPADDGHRQHRIVFARGYFASALHEISHWCIAGEERRLMEDYGYWYEPDGRNAKRQAEFEVVEIKPQAVEWILSASCGFRFQVSCDNLSGDSDSDWPGFTNKVRNQVIAYLELGMPPRAQVFSDVLRKYYDVPLLQPENFQ